jgi:hypothetical protein
MREYHDGLTAAGFADITITPAHPVARACIQRSSGPPSPLLNGSAETGVAAYPSGAMSIHTAPEGEYDRRCDHRVQQSGDGRSACRTRRRHRAP